MRCWLSPRGPVKTERSSFSFLQGSRSPLRLAVDDVVSCLALAPSRLRADAEALPVVNMLTPEQTRSLSSSFMSFSDATQMKAPRTRSPCSPLNDSPVPPMPRLLGKRPRS